MRITIDADVSQDVIRDALTLMKIRLVDEQPLNDLEVLGWLVLSHYISCRLTAVSADRLGTPPRTDAVNPAAIEQHG